MPVMYTHTHRSHPTGEIVEFLTKLILVYITLTLIGKLSRCQETGHSTRFDISRGLHDMG